MRILALAFVALFASTSAGCVATLGGLAGLGQALQAQDAAAGVASGAGGFMLFGGEGHKTYLGCLCGAYGAESIFNSSSPYGSSYGSASIFNHYSAFGSKYSAQSACNPYASDPPVIVNGGQVVGRLSLNKYTAGALTDEKILGWLAAICQ